MKTSPFNEKFLTQLLNKIFKEEKICLLMAADFNVNLLSIENKSEILDFYDALPSHFFVPYIL